MGQEQTVRLDVCVCLRRARAGISERPCPPSATGAGWGLSGLAEKTAMPAVLSTQFLDLSFLPLNEVAVLSMDEPFQGFIFVSLLRELAPTGARAQ